MCIKNENKIVYCKKCGNLIDNKTRKCGGCEKQYFRFSKLIFIWCVLAVLVIGLGVLNVYQYLIYEDSKLSYESTIESKEEYLSSYKEAYNAVSNTRDKMQIELNFWNNNAVICTTEGNKYHHYGCGHLVGVKSGYIFSINEAERKGYAPCLDCCVP